MTIFQRLALALALLLPSALLADGIQNGGSGSGGGGTGTVTSIATTCGVSGGTITTTGTIQAITTPNPQTGTNYPIVTTDCGKVVNLSNASNQIPTIPQAGSAGFLTGWATEVCNQGAGTQTITPATSTIGGAATYVLAAGTAAAPKCIGVVSDGVNYQLDMTGPGGTGTSFANPTGTASDTAVNGVSNNAMRSDAAPAIQKGTNAQFGVVEGDGKSVLIASGVASMAPGAIHPGYVASSVWWLPLGQVKGNATSGGSLATTTAYCSPGYFGGNSLITVGSLGANVTTAGSSNDQFAIYNDNAAASPHRPGTFIKATGSIVNTSITQISGALTSSSQLSPLTWYWFCAQSADTTMRLTSLAASGGDTTYSTYIGSTGLSHIVNPTTGYAGVSTPTGITSFGTWPDFSAATFTETATPPMIAVQFSSVP